jgi:hypothetical protein
MGVQTTKEQLRWPARKMPDRADHQTLITPDRRDNPSRAAARSDRSLGASLTSRGPSSNCADVRLTGNDGRMPHRVLMAAAREVRDVLRAATPTHRRLRDALVAIATATIGVDLICAIAAFLLERHTHQTEIHTLGSAAFWTTTQLLTVSFQIINPISIGGRILDVFMEAYAITVVATMAGALGSFLQKRGREIDDQH